MTGYKIFYDQGEMKKLSEINMHQNFFNALWELTGGKEDKDNFIQKALQVCKVFKVKPLKAPRPDVLSKKTTYNLLCKDIRKIKKKLQGVPVSKVSAIISEEWKKVKVSDKKMKKYRNLFEEELSDHMDEIETINLRKKCNKTDTKAAR